ncbi:MAG: YncE family protein, partial [Thermoplasmata archaeon]
ITVDPVTNMVYVVNSGSNNMSVINGNTNQIVTTIAVGKEPGGVAVDTKTDIVYVANSGSNNISVVKGVS